MTAYTEGEVRIAALEVLSEAPVGLTTTQLRHLLTGRLAPDGHDAELVESRGSRDTFFDQRVRNLTSHRTSSVSLMGAGFVTYAGAGSPLTITPAGRAYLAEARRDGTVTEGEYRRRQWNALAAQGGPLGVIPAVLNELRIYRGAQGIWTDTERTSQYGPEMSPVTVAVLHTGTQHPEALDATGLVFHYPATARGGRDLAGIEATRRAARLQLPIFVVTHAADNDQLRDVRRATVIGWDDDTSEFELLFGNIPAAITTIRAATVRSAGRPYRRANERPATAQRDPFEIDPNAVDRALAAHARTQNALADWVVGRGLQPLSSFSRSLDFDLAWIDGEDFFVAEVKSLSRGNEARQLRLGLGQVLHYQALLQDEGRFVRPLLVVEREPAEARWSELCAAHGVALIWPGEFGRIVAER